MDFLCSPYALNVPSKLKDHPMPIQNEKCGAFLWLFWSHKTIIFQVWTIWASTYGSNFPHFPGGWGVV